MKQQFSRILQSCRNATKQRLVIFLFIFTLLLQIGATTILFTQSANAVVPPSQYKAMEMSRVVLKCAEDKGLTDWMIPDSIGKRWIFGNGNSSGTVKDINETSYQVSALVQSDGAIQCGSAVLTPFAAAGIRYEEDYVDTFFEKDPESNENGYRLKSRYKESDLLNFITTKFKAKGWEGRPIPYVSQALKSVFSECTTTTDKYNYDPGDQYMFEYDGKYYKLKGGKGKGDSKTDKDVGPIIDPSDGVWSCGEFMKNMKSGSAFAEGKSLADIMLGDALEEAQTEQNLAAKISAITDVLKENPSLLNNCFAVLAVPGFTMPESNLRLMVAAWLGMEGSDLPAETTSRQAIEGILRPGQLGVFKKCLTDSYGQALATAMQTELDFSEQEESDEGDSCYDTIEPLFVIPLTNVKVPNPLKWFVCGVAQLLTGLIDGATGVVKDLLRFNPTSEEDGGEQLRAAWGGVLTLANILFIIAFLIMVLSTVLDLGILSNYTVKKLLPRIILSAVLANLSWEICSILINSVNLIGDAARTVILFPLQETSSPTSLQNAAGQIIADNGTAVTVGLGALIYASIASAGAILLPTLAIMAVGAVTAVLVLLLRRVIIIVLIFLAPLALILYALPGGEGLAKRWWKTFAQMLLMYPIIMMLFASGILISGLLDFSGNDDLISQAMQAIVLFVPFFVLPMVFKMAGGALANVTGMVNDRSKGLVDRSRKWKDENSQYGRRKQLKAQRKNYTGHENLIKSMGADSMGRDNAAGRWLQRRRRSQGLGRNWAQGHDTKETQNSFLDKMEAAVSKEQKDAADYRARAAGGGIDAKRKDGNSKQFRVTRAGTKEAIWLGKDAAVAEAWKGATVDAMEETYDASGRFTGYSDKVEGTLFDGSKAAQRSAGSLAGAQALTPVIDAVRNGDSTGTINQWKQYDQNGNELSGFHKIESLSDQYINGNANTVGAGGLASSREAAGVASAVLAEVKEGYAGNLSGKMPSFIKGEALAFGGIQSEALSGFHENEVVRLMEYADSNRTGSKADVWGRIGQSVKQIVEHPEKYNMSPKSLEKLKAEYTRVGGAGMDANLDAYMKLVNADGTLQRINSDGSVIPKTSV